MVVFSSFEAGRQPRLPNLGLRGTCRASGHKAEDASRGQDELDVVWAATKETYDFSLGLFL